MIKSILHNFKLGDREAAREIYRSYSDYTAAIVCRLLPHDVVNQQDVLQRVWLKIIASAAGLKAENEVSFLSYIKTVTVNTVYDYCRERGRQPVCIEPEQLDRIEDDTVDLEQKLAANEVFKSFASKLSQEEQQVLTGYYAEGRTVKEIAAMMSIKPRRVKYLLKMIRTTAARDKGVRQICER